MTLKSHITISTIALGASESMVLRVSLGILESSGIKVTSLDKGDTSGTIVIVDVDMPEGRDFYRLFESKKNQVLLVLSSENLNDTRNMILRKPVRVQTLKDVLLDLCTEKSKTLFDTYGAQSTKPSAPEKNLFFILLESRDEKKIRQIFNPPFPAIYINGFDNVLAFSGTQDSFRKMMQAPSYQLEIKSLAWADFNSLARGQIIIPLLDALWTAALFGSQGQLIPGHSPDTPILLKGWPNFSRVEFDSDHMRLTSIMSKQVLTLNQLHEKTQIDYKKIVSFYNALWSASLIQANFALPTTAVPTHSESKQSEPKKAGLLARIAQRLSFSKKFS